MMGEQEEEKEAVTDYKSRKGLVRVNFHKSQLPNATVPVDKANQSDDPVMRYLAGQSVMCDTFISFVEIK